MLVEVKFSKKAKEDCLRGGLPIDYLKKEILEEIEGKTMHPLLNDIIGFGVVYEEKPMIVFGKQYEDLLLIDEVAFNVVLIDKMEKGETVVQKHDYVESEQYIALKNIKDKEELLLSPIEDLDVNIAIYHRLSKAGVRTIGDLIDKSEEYYKDNKILSSSYIGKLKGRLSGLNLDLKSEADY